MTDPLTGRFLAMPLTMERLKQTSVINKKTGCLEWCGNRSKFGYGKVTHRYKTWMVHRVSWELTFGKIPDGLFVLHHCDNPPCFNPAHLFLGTTQDNKDDSIKKGRHVFGVRQHLSKLNPSKVKEILRSKQTPLQLSKRLGVTRETIYHIRNGRIWKQVTGLNYVTT